MMFILKNISKKRAELKEFTFENYYRGVGFTKENNYYLIKHAMLRICYCLQLE